jgi:hypothetical protein
VIYNPSKEPPSYDVFGPKSAGNYIRLPEGFKVSWVGSEEDIPNLLALLDEPYIGVDSEWRPTLTKFHKTKGIGLFQISGQKVCFLVDMAALKNSIELDKVLTKVFSNKFSTIVGFSFSSDIQQFKKKLPNMQFY